MPYMRSMRRNRRPKYSRKRRFTRRKSNRVMTVNRVRRIIDAELKFKVRSIGTIAVPDTVGFLTPITSDILEGTDAISRIGNWIKPINLHGAVTVTGNTAAMAAENFFGIRVGFVLWKNDE